MTTDNNADSDSSSAKSFYNLVVWTSAVVFLLPVAVEVFFLQGSIKQDGSVALKLLLLPFAMLALFLLAYNLIFIPAKLRTALFTATQRLVLKAVWILSVVFVVLIAGAAISLLAS